VTDHRHQADHEPKHGHQPEHGHEPEHEHGHEPEHGHHAHQPDWRTELAAMREQAAHYYEHQFDWRGHDPPTEFEGPRFFPPSAAWRREAWLDTDAPGTGDQVTLPTSTGKLRDMTIAGQLVFDVDGAEQRLIVYLGHGRDGSEYGFVPFRDATSGAETYGSGRYLDLDYDPAATDYLLDFNFAYNPSCAFSPAYDCPYPPAGNRLSVRVEAGEMVPFEHS
jgi:hypothetical protein